MNQSIITAEWLNNELHNNDLVILDCTLLNQLTKLSSEIQEIQIENARFFDIKNKFSDVTDKFPSAYPSKSQFEKGCRALGINNESTIVVYDANGIYSSPRAWWLFKSMGHSKVFVLNGGLPEWMKNDFPTEDKTKRKYPKGNFVAKLNWDIVRRFDALFNNLSSKKELTVDVRSESRFNGLVPETRKGLRSGNIENSINLPYTKFLSDGLFVFLWLQLVSYI